MLRPLVISEPFLKKVPNLTKTVSALYDLRRDEYPQGVLLSTQDWFRIFDYSGLSKDNIVSWMDGAVLLAWRFSQGIYIFEPEIKKELLEATIPDIFPLNIFEKLPEWSLYVEIKETIAGKFIYGFFALLDYVQGAECLIISIDFEDGDEIYNEHLLTLPLIITDSITVAEAVWQVIERTGEFEVGDDKHIEYATHNFVKPCLSLLLYICQDEPEIEARDKPYAGIKPAHNYPKKVKEGFKLFMPDKPRIWKVGEKISRLIRQGAAHHTEGKKSPHLRRAHWHGYYRGKGKSEFFFKFLPIISVNSDLGE
jgi:hypothetical protein